MESHEKFLSDAKQKQAIAGLITGNPFSNQKEFVRELTRLKKDEIVELESVLGLTTEQLNEMGRSDIHFKNVFNHWFCIVNYVNFCFWIFFLYFI